MPTPHSPEKTDEPKPPTSRRVAALPLAAALIGLEGVVTVAFGAYLMVAGAVGHPSSLARAEIAGALVLVLGLAVVLVGWGVLRGRSWSRAPAVLVQVFCLPVAWGLLQGGRYGIAVPIGVVAIALLALLLGPAGRLLRR